MIGLIIKDFLVFKKRFHLTYRLIGAAVLGLVIILYPAEGAQYVALLLPVMGVAFLTEIVKVEEKSDWRDYLPALPIISREIVLSRYLFCGILLAAFAATSFVIFPRRRFHAIQHHAKLPFGCFRCRAVSVLGYSRRILFQK